LKGWYELKFHLQFRSKFGTEFQDFFTSIMERGYPSDFQKVKPYGNQGDRKCDGYQQSLKRVYQVYAPEKMEAKNTTNKIEEDFTGAIKHWGNKMESWIFVDNQWRGIPPQVLEKLIGIDGRDKVAVGRWSEIELRNEFFRLQDEHQEALLGPSPTLQAITGIQMKDVVTVVNVIAQQDSLPPQEVQEVPPGKLKANALSDDVQNLLKTGSRRAKLIKSFFGSWHDPELGDRVARAFKSKYEALRSKGIVANEAFFELWRFSGGGIQKSVEHEAAVLALLAFLFEECEIFEKAPFEAPN
jgi:hypothetical protein